jgi:hypothetical protein
MGNVHLAKLICEMDFIVVMVVVANQWTFWIFFSHFPFNASKLHIYLKIRTKSNKMPIIYKIMLDKFGLN